MLQTCDIEINDVNKYNKSSGRIYTAEKTDGRARKMKPKRLIALFMITFLSVGLFQGTGTIGAAASPAFTISKTSFIRGETAVFKCENADSSMHISIMNEGYKNYVYSPTGEKGDRRATIYCTANELTYITQNLQPGNYVAVLFGEGWYKYQETAFSVTADPNAPDFSVDKTRYTKGEKIIFSFSALFRGDRRS